MSRAYLECDHYNVVYPEDTVVMGGRQFCPDCGVYRKVTRLSDGEQSIQVTYAQALEELVQELIGLVESAKGRMSHYDVDWEKHYQEVKEQAQQVMSSEE